MDARGCCPSKAERERAAAKAKEEARAAAEAQRRAAEVKAEAERRAAEAKAKAEAERRRQENVAKAKAEAEANAKAAQMHIARADSFLKRNEYQAAIDEYQEASSLLDAPTPYLLLQLATAYRLNDQPKQAISTYEAYLSLRDTGVDADAARRYRDELQAQLDEARRQSERREQELREQQERAQAAEREAAEARDREEAERLKREADERQRAEIAEAERLAREAEARQAEAAYQEVVSRNHGRRVAAVTLTAIGVAFAGAGFLCSHYEQKSLDAITAGGLATRDDIKSEARSVEVFRASKYVGYGIGAGLAAIAVPLLFSSLGTPDRPRTEISISAHGISLQATF